MVYLIIYKNGIYYGIYGVYYAGTQLAWYARRENPPGNFTFFAKNLENGATFQFFAIFGLFVKKIGTETYMAFESRTVPKFWPSFSSSLARDEKL